MGDNRYTYALKIKKEKIDELRAEAQSLGLVLSNLIRLKLNQELNITTKPLHPTPQLNEKINSENQED